MSPTEQLQKAFTSALGVPPETNFESVTYGQTAGWDSVAHLSLVAEIESAFDLMLDTDDVIAMSSFPEARKILGKYGVDFH